MEIISDEIGLKLSVTECTFIAEAFYHALLSDAGPPFSDLDTFQTEHEDRFRMMKAFYMIAGRDEDYGNAMYNLECSIKGTPFK